MPTRFEHSVVTPKYDFLNWNSNNGEKPSLTSTILGNYTVSRDIVLGGDVHGWRYYSKRNINVTTPLSATMVNYDFQSGSINVVQQLRDQNNDHAIYNTTSYEKYGCFCAPPGVPYPSGSFDQEMIDTAMVGINRAIAKTYRQLQGLVVAGEFVETLHMIRNPANALFRGVFDYLSDVKKRTRRAKFDRATKIIANTWLEYSFGWAPLVKDVQDGAKALARIQLGPPEQARVGYNCGGQKLIGDFHGEVGTGPYQLYERTLTIEEVDVKMYGVVKCPIQNGAVRASKLLGVSWSDIVPAVWELIPYSFLVDYFTNVGDIIDAYATSGTELAWLVIGVKKTAKSSRNQYGGYIIPTTNPGVEYLSTQVSGASASASTVIKSRSDASEMCRVPSLSFSIPGLGKQFLNLSALKLAGKR